MGIKKVEEHTGLITEKKRDIFRRHIFVIKSAGQNISVIVGKGLFDLHNIGDAITVGHIGKKLMNIRRSELSPEAAKWNRFIDEICGRQVEKLTAVQQNAVLPFWYDAEMNSCGHSGYFDLYTDVNKDDLVDCLNAIGAEHIALNFVEARSANPDDEYIETDNRFYEAVPSLADILMEYVSKHSNEIFEEI